MIPGKEISNSLPITRQIEAALNPLGVRSSELIGGWKPSSPQEAASLFSEGTCYLWRQHPVLAFKNKLYEADVEETRNFLLRRFSEERGDGIDIIVTSSSLSRIVVGNHDGELFIAVQD